MVLVVVQTKIITTHPSAFISVVWSGVVPRITGKALEGTKGRNLPFPSADSVLIQHMDAVEGTSSHCLC